MYCKSYTELIIPDTDELEKAKTLHLSRSKIQIVFMEPNNVLSIVLSDAVPIPAYKENLRKEMDCGFILKYNYELKAHFRESEGQS